MKGQHEALTIIIITGILLGVMGAVWLWSAPIIEGNKETFLLSSTEDFLEKLAAKIRAVARNGGKEQVAMADLDRRGSLLMDNDSIEIFMITRETPYDKNVQIPLNEIGCATTRATWGLNSSNSACILSVRIDEGKVRTTFSIRFVELAAAGGPNNAYRIKLLPQSSASGLDKNYIVLENKGTEQSDAKDGTLISTLVAISVI